jgi:ribosomal protein S18 acetylase RimI-like enzyme
MTLPMYRSATLSDLNELVRLRVSMQKEVNEFTDTQVPANYLDDVKKYFQRTLLNGTYFSAVAETREKLVAAAGLVLYEKPPAFGGRSGLVGYITNVYTEPECRGRGIATQLMEIIIKHARSSEVVKLHLGTTESGKGVYERVGFQPVRFAALELKF